jgi:CubicO group peptidase (beta-lactamase class C family)
MTTPLDNIRTFVQDIMQKWKVPGLSLAIVKDGEILTAEGFGLRNIEDSLPLDADTLLPIGSCTKAFTAMSVALQVDAGKLDWDKPVREVMTDYKLFDTFASERITPRDLLCHRSGLPRHELLWYGSNFSRKEVLRRLRFVEPNCDFRTKFQYQNMMYMTAGYLVGYVDNTHWEDVVQRQILDRLDMNNTNFSTKETQVSTNFAAPYSEKEDVVVKIPFFESDGANDSTGPAGNLISCANDMVKWLLLNLNKGQYNGEQVISEASLKQMHTPQMVQDDSTLQQVMGLKLPSYGLGWFIGTFNGETLIQHGGNINGFSALTSFLPEHNVGITVLVNLDHSFVPSIVSYSIYQQLLGLPAYDWDVHYRKISDEFKAAQKQGRSRSASDRVEGTQPSHALDAYVGDYEHAGYGVLSFRKDGDKLICKMNDKLTFAVTNYHYDVFELYLEDFDLTLKATFYTDIKGNISGLSIQLDGNVPEIQFKRLPPKVDQALVSAAEGVYEWAAMNVVITILRKGEEELVMQLAGQQDRTLVPYQGTEFLVKDLTGYSVDFKREADGNVNGAVLVQPGMAVNLTKRAS